MHAGRIACTGKWIGGHIHVPKYVVRYAPIVTGHQVQAAGHHFIVGRTNSAPLAMPVGQRAVTVFMRV
jgi:hypothetical protein